MALAGVMGLKPSVFVLESHAGVFVFALGWIVCAFASGCAWRDIVSVPRVLVHTYVVGAVCVAARCVLACAAAIPGIAEVL